MATLPINLKLSKKTIDEAHICAEALWYGINYKNLKPTVPDEELLQYFAEPMYRHGKNVANFNPDIFRSYVKKLISACGLNALNLGAGRMDLLQGIATIKGQIYQHFYDVQKMSPVLPAVNLPINAINDLSSGIVTHPKYHQIILASRILFFNTPNIEIFNISSGISRNIGFTGRPYKYLTAFNLKMHRVYLANRTQLSKCKKPKILLLTGVLANSFASTTWWERRVLDLALLLHFKEITFDVNLPQRVRAARNLRNRLMARKMQAIKTRKVK